MHSSGSQLMTVIERVRAWTDDTEIDAKYSNDFLIRHIISPAYAEVFSRIAMDQDNPVVIRHTVNLLPDVEFYTLPPHIFQVHRLAKRNATTGLVTNDLYPLNQMSPYGPGWAIQGNTLQIRPVPTSADTVELWYTPSSDVGICYHTGNPVITYTSTTAVLTATPTRGFLDIRPNALAGLHLRTLATSLHQDRIIESYNVSTGTVTLRNAFDTTPSNATPYEVVPPGFGILAETIALRAALKLARLKRTPGTVLSEISAEYAGAIKSVRDNLAGIMSRAGHGFDRLTIDNPDLRYFTSVRH